MKASIKGGAGEIRLKTPALRKIFSTLRPFAVPCDATIRGKGIPALDRTDLSALRGPKVAAAPQSVFRLGPRMPLLLMGPAR